MFHAPLLGALAEFDLRAIAGAGDALRRIGENGIKLVVISTPNETHYPSAHRPRSSRPRRARCSGCLQDRQSSVSSS
ncbi:MAG: hypothetical protein M3N06_04160 [Pseudomonadota bacterium]|nr:hypothetical protein [Pseudomonadota bacterium]